MKFKHLNCLIAHERICHSNDSKRQAWRKLSPAAQKRGFARGSNLGSRDFAKIFLRETNRKTKNRQFWLPVYFWLKQTKPGGKCRPFILIVPKRHRSPRPNKQVKAARSTPLTAVLPAQNSVNLADLFRDIPDETSSSNLFREQGLLALRDPICPMLRAYCSQRTSEPAAE